MTLRRALGAVDEALDGAIAILSAGGDRQLALRELHDRGGRRARESSA